MLSSKRISNSPKVHVLGKGESLGRQTYFEESEPKGVSFVHLAKIVNYLHT
jgi:hypothetical protein